jgi:putative transposase
MLGVRYQTTVLGGLLKAVSRRRFGAMVASHDADRYVKGFSSWDHLVTLVFAQLGGLSSLREVEAIWNAQAIHHYHLGSGPVRRSTLSDANQRRPSRLFAEVLADLTALASRSLRRAGKEVLRLLDATPIPLTSLEPWAVCNGRTRGLKAHLVYDPDADRPVFLEVTPATLNEVMATT